MKVTLEIEYELDGQEPDRDDVVHILSNVLTRCLLSEEINKPELWALMPKEYSIHILPNSD